MFKNRVVWLLLLFFIVGIFSKKEEKVRPLNPQEIREYRDKKSKEGKHFKTKEEIDLNGGHWCKNPRTGLEKRQLSVCSSNSQCDLPDVVLAYLDSNTQGILPTLNLSVNVITFAKSDYSSPLTTSTDTSFQLGVLNTAYASIGVEFDMRFTVINDDYLSSLVVFDGSCPTSNIGDGNCNLDCNYTESGYDGLDCLGVPTTNCPSASNGVCDINCNYPTTNWDHGDCCGPTKVSTCRDPNSPWIGWTDLDGIKSAVSSTPTADLNLFIVKFSSESSTLGIATFPWDSNSLQATGGVCFNAIPAWGSFPPNFDGETAVHELGHIFGLFHTHTGVSEISGSTPTQICSNPCFESTPLMTNGDLCSDTNPTVINYQCNDPVCTSVSTLMCDTCSGQPWINTPFRNYMGYADDTCVDNFSPQQRGRMRCFIDEYFSSWTGQTRPSVVAWPPTLNEITGTSSSLYLNWRKPVYLGSTGSVTYTIERTPAFAAPVEGITNLFYTDTTVSSGISYSYRILAVGSNSVPAASLGPWSCNWVVGSTPCGGGSFVTAAPTPTPTPSPVILYTSVLQDPSFEKGNLYWTATGSMYKILCNEADTTNCLGYANTGTGYLQFGYSLGPEDSTVSQDFTIDEGGLYALNFATLIIDSTATPYQLNFLLDGEIVATLYSTQTSLYDGNYNGLVVTFSISSGTHTFAINFNKDTSGDVFVLVDDISLAFDSPTAGISSGSLLGFTLFALFL